MNRSMAEYAEAYRVTQPLPPAAEEAEFVSDHGRREGRDHAANTG